MRETILLLQSEPSYRRLLLASLLSGLGDWFNSVSLLSLLLRLTGGGLAVGLTLAIRTLPVLIMGPIGGWLADRMNRKAILLVCDFARAGAPLSFLFIRQRPDVWIAYAGTLMLVIFSALFSPARTAVIPQLVHPERVLQANALEQSTFGFVMTVGAALGGVVTASLGADVAFVANAASFLASGLLVLSIRFPNAHLSRARHPSTTSDESEEPTEPAGTKAVKESIDVSGTQPGGRLSWWTVVRESRTVQAVTLQSLLWPMGGGVINVLISVYGYQVFHAGNVGVGVLYAALGVGFLCSGVIAHRFTARMRPAAVVGFVTEGLCHAGVSQAPNLWMAGVGMMVATLGAGVGNAAVTTLVMQSVSTEVHGRVFALCDTISNTALACSMLTAGILLDHVSARTLGLASGLLIAFASLATGWILLQRPVREQAASA